MTYNDKSALVTGGCSGIGLEISRQFLKRGVQNLAILDINDGNDTVEKLKSEFKSKTILYFKTDVSNKQEVESSLNNAFSEFHNIDIVVCNAGIMNEVDIQRTVNVNLIGVINTTYAALDLMSKCKGGNGGIIVCNSSVTALDTFYSVPLYSATKHATLGFFRSLGHEYYEEHGIKFMTLCPTATMTNILATAKPIGPAEPLHPLEKFSAKNVVTLYSYQTAEAAANAMADVIAFEKNDSIWIIDNGEYKEIKIDKFYYNKEIL